MTQDATWERQRSSFGTAAAAYERGRPGYPVEALDWLLPPGARRVLDLAAGTGKLTRLLVERGLDVVAVEPSAGMRAEFARVLPGVPVLAGKAEDIPLDDGSVDAVLVAQAWHWVDPELACPEIARVLVPGGRLGLVWNLRHPDSGWVAELERLLHETDEADDTSDRPSPVVVAPFRPLREREVLWTDAVTQDAVLDLVASRSYVITMDPPRRDVLLGRVRDLVSRHPDTAGHRCFPMPYLALCFRTSSGSGISSH
jgi:SAM-dependent methyltransferase